jgi:hypothetical protein
MILRQVVHLHPDDYIRLHNVDGTSAVRRVLALDHMGSSKSRDVYGIRHCELGPITEVEKGTVMETVASHNHDVKTRLVYSSDLIEVV